MTLPRPSRASVSPRTVSLGFAILALGAALMLLLGQRGAWSADFAGSYAATRALTDAPSTNVYDYATLSLLNASHQYIHGAISPFTYPPFMLLALRPLTLLPFDAAHGVWLALIMLCTLATAFFLARAVAALAQHMATADESAGATPFAAFLANTTVRLGGVEFPAALFAAFAGLLLVLPALDARYWGQAQVVALVLIALALDAHLRRRPLVAGIALGLASGFSFAALAVLLCFVPRGAWKLLTAAVASAVVVAIAPLLLVSLSGYRALFTATRFLSGVYATSTFNNSLRGLAANTLVVTFHTGATSFLSAEKAATWGGYAVVALTVIVLALSALHYIVRRSVWSERGMWVGIAAVLAAWVLAVPVSWPFDAFLVAPAALMLGSIPLIERRADTRSLANGLVLAAAALAMLLLIVPTALGIDGQEIAQGTPGRWLYLLRPIAALLVWAGALFALVAPHVAPVLARVLRRRPRARGERSATTATAAAE
ncbi:MAG TPA: glycosyltransferase family 87 protein [Ktedonobacterales bacterium]